MINRREQAAVLALVSKTEGKWYRVGALVEEVGSALRVVNGGVSEVQSMDLRDVDDLATSVSDDDVARFAQQIEDLGRKGVGLLTVLEDDYPSNLREVYNKPPFIWVRGELVPADRRSVSVVGTRRASPEGKKLARRLASELASQGVTVLSGLALGIDTEAHEGALDARGRTIAVLGHGIDRPVYPKENEGLARRIVEGGSGAVLSQFWPDAPPTRYSFPMRNAITSAMGVGTVVIEAHGRSGAKNQATQCLDHGKLLFLVERLVLHEDWAKRYAERPGARVVRDVDDVLSGLTAVLEAPEQLALC